MDMILACLFGLVGVMFIRACIAGVRAPRPPGHAGSSQAAPGQADDVSFTQQNHGTGVPAADDAGTADATIGFVCPDPIVTGFPDPPPACYTPPSDH